ncbi:MULTISPECIES: STAS-like domain-containing protein [unclassified Shinella]|uniref:STAS-like domain-containing protein n=1 Tax=unclassified Shinella TaxID=2643062 RepID=UPI0009EA01A6|nr:MULTISPECIES: STAS-like domain-containing protein [unclassified Shinella]
MKETKISISSIVGGGICVSASDGQKVYEHVQKAVQSGDRVTLSFSGVSRMTTAFLNAAVGQLYGEFSEGTLRKRLAPPVDFEEWHLARLKMVVDRAKVYFRNQENVESILGDHAGRRR